MATREQMIERIQRALLAASWPDGSIDGFPSNRVAGMLARAVSDAILPQVTTVAELEALHPRAQVMDRAGFVARAGSVMADETVRYGGWLTVVWQPEISS